MRHSKTRAKRSGLGVPRCSQCRRSAGSVGVFGRADQFHAGFTGVSRRGGVRGRGRPRPRPAWCRWHVAETAKSVAGRNGRMEWSDWTGQEERPRPPRDRGGAAAFLEAPGVSTFDQPPRLPVGHPGSVRSGRSLRLRRARRGASSPSRRGASPWRGALRR